jgi:hypothetical protein
MLFITATPFGPVATQKFIKTQIGDSEVWTKINGLAYTSVNEVQADGEELELCFKLLSRTHNGQPVYTFVGESAQEIVKNWGWVMGSNETLMNL